MLKKELTAALAMMGVIAPFAAHADQPMSSTSGQQKTAPAYTAGESVRTGDLPGAYNQSANYKIDDSYDIYFTADFIYWNLQQDSMRVGNLLDPDSSGSLGLLNGENETVFNSGKYKPGFQVGLGFNMNGMDGWNLYSEYTWYQNKHSNTVDAGSGEGIALSFIKDGAPEGITDDIVLANSVSTDSKYHFNNLNLELQRPFYFGRKLTANFGAGLRALWISQTVTGSASGLTAYEADSSSSGTSIVGQSASFHQKSWGLGPRFELDTNWMLGWGFRILANIAESVLYTRYTTLTGKIDGGVSEVGTTADFTSTVGGANDTECSSSSNYNTLRAITETSLGLGWGSYFGDNNDFHFDITASYEFNIYWNQNMYGMVVNGHGSPGNTYLQGLNIAARFDF
ncbi:MAG: Lpg1974 family pore-forming outer membrane protein [Chlamydiota bacterium]